MQGVIFTELSRYVEATLGHEVWRNVLEAAGLYPRKYFADRSYADEEFADILSRVCARAGLSQESVLESLGQSMGPHLLSRYKSLIRTEWSTLDVVEHTEETIHKVVRLQNDTAQPPRLIAQREGPDQVEIRYASHRKLCALAIGIIRGIAADRGDTIEVLQPCCMLRGDSECKIRVKVLRGSEG